MSAAVFERLHLKTKEIREQVMRDAMEAYGNVWRDYWCRVYSGCPWWTTEITFSWDRCCATGELL